MKELANAAPQRNAVTFHMPRKRKVTENPSVDGARALADNGRSEQPALKKKRATRQKPKEVAAETVGAVTPQVSDEAIRLRAYFISEERIRLGRPGDAHSDWLEARRQLVAELR